MNEIEQLKHRLAMVEDDLKVIKMYIGERNLDFDQPTFAADTCWTHIFNIQIACNLESDECLTWKPFFI